MCGASARERIMKMRLHRAPQMARCRCDRIFRDRRIVCAKSPAVWRLVAILFRRLVPAAAVVFVLSLLTGTAAASSSAPAAAPRSTGTARPLYAALGDSITFGYNLSRGPQIVPSVQAYPFLAGTALGYDTVDNGIPGLTTSGLLRLVTTGQYNQQLRQARLVTIDIGSNDLLQIAGAYLASQRPLPAAVTRGLREAEARFATLDAQLIRAVAARTNARIVLLNLYDPLPPGSPLFWQSEQSIGAMNRVVTRVAAAFQLPVIDVYSLFNGRQLVDVRVLEHDVHPTAAGQAVIAASLVQALRAPGQLASLVPARYATLSGPTALYGQGGLTGRATVLAAGTTVRIVSPGYARAVRVQTVSGRPAAGYLPSGDLRDVFARYRPYATFGAGSGELTTGGYRVSANGRPLALSTPPVVWRGQICLPVAQVASALGFQAVFEGNTDTVTITPAAAPTGATKARSSVHGASVAVNSRTAPGAVQYRGVGLFVDNARVAAPSQAEEPFFWRGQVYASLPVIARAFHLSVTTHASRNTIALLTLIGPTPAS